MATRYIFTFGYFGSTISRKVQHFHRTMKHEFIIASLSWFRAYSTYCLHFFFTIVSIFTLVHERTVLLLLRPHKTYLIIYDHRSGNAG